MFYALMGYLHAAAVERVRAIRALAESERGQGTVEYVGLILLVSLLMVGMVAAMKGFNKSISKTRNRFAPSPLGRRPGAVVRLLKVGRRRLTQGTSYGCGEQQNFRFAPATDC
jgi:Flp pilus assembly pilin Flp